MSPSIGMVHPLRLSDQSEGEPRAPASDDSPRARDALLNYRCKNYFIAEITEA